MTLQYSFPFCAVSDITDQLVTAEISISTKFPSAVGTKSVTLQTLGWDNQHQQDSIIIEVESSIVLNQELEVGIIVKSNQPTPILFFEPVILDNINGYKLTPLSQEVKGTEFKTENMWYNMPVCDTEYAKVYLDLMKNHETLDDVADFMKNSITYRDQLTYKTRIQNKPVLSMEENIEYYLGKDRYSNKFFPAKLPAAWDIPVRAANTSRKPLAYTSVYDTDKNIEYTINNLGYRSKFDYHLEALKETDVVVCLGDSDVFGAYNEFETIWSSQLQEKLSNDVTVLNFGIRGLSSDGVTRIGTRVVEALQTNIVAVCLHWPPPSLREFVSKKYKCGVHTHRNYHLPYEDWWKHIDWQSNNYNHHKNRILISSVCEKHGIPFYELIANKEDYSVPYDLYEFGVYDSFGPATHTAIANYFFKKITGQPSLFQSMQS